MITVNIIAVGQIKDGFNVSACNEYIKRLSKYCKLNVIEIKEQNLPKNYSNKDVENLKNAESENIKKHITNGHNILLNITGVQYSSADFANKIKEISNTNSTVNFIIGGSHGTSNSLVGMCENISFSKLTFPHQLFRVILLEQIYRAFTIIANLPYHK